MTTARPDVVAVSSSEQERETLLIMLDSDFDVTAIAAPPAMPPVPRADAVVLTATAWDASVVRRARACWPRAPLVLVDAPESARAASPGSPIASWSDPLSVPAAVAEAVACGGREDDTADALSAAVFDAHADLAPCFAGIAELAALLEVVRLPASIGISARLLCERIAVLGDRLVWVDGLEPDEDEAAESIDLAALLRAEVGERLAQSVLRHIEFDWRLDDACVARCSERRARALVRCLRAALLELPPGPVAVESRAGSLRCRHRDLPASAPKFMRAVTGTIARWLGARWQDDGASLAVVPQ